MLHSEFEIGLLEDLFAELPAGPQSMSLGEFDGFCTGLVVCPAPILPSEWLPLVLGDKARMGLRSLDEIQRLTNLIIGHYNRVARSLEPPATDYAPVIELDPFSSGRVWGDWVIGFEHSMALRPESWEEIALGDDEAAASIRVLMSLYQIEAGGSALDEEAVKAYSAQATSLLPGIVLSLNRRSKTQSTHLPLQTTANENSRPRQ